MTAEWGADQIPYTAPRIDPVAALSAARHLPVEALEEATRRPQAIADSVLREAGRAAAGNELDEQACNLLFWGSHVLAVARDSRLAAPLLGVLRRGGELPLGLFGDVAETTLPKLVASSHDGDADALEAAIADRGVDELFRWSLFGAYAFLVFDGRIGRERARAFLVRFDDERLARAGEAAWAGWEEAIALLGFGELCARRDAAVADARLLADEEAHAGFRAALDLAQREPRSADRFEAHGLGYLTDAIAELDEALGDEESGDGDLEPIEPAQNPMRHVGRNDPCPCGSGKKYKKCCLTDAA